MEQTTNNQTADQSEVVKGEKPWPLIIMLCMLFSVIFAGFILVPKTEEQKLRWLSILGTNNYGELMNPPLDLTDQLRDSEGNLWGADLDIPWKLVLINQGACTEACQEMSDFITRVHTRMNKLAPDLKRGYLGLGAGAEQGPDSSLGFAELQTDNVNLPDLLRESGAPSLSEGPLVFLMDPLQVFFIFYTTEHQEVGMLEDIEHLMKLAQ